MAITLTSAIGYNDGVLPVSGDLPLPWRAPCLVVIDSEFMQVLSAGPTGWEVVRAQQGSLPATHASGAVVGPYAVVPISPVYGPTGTIAETIPRNVCTETNNTIFTTGQVAMQLIWLRAGMTVSNISICTATTLATTPTHNAIGLCSLNGTVLASSADLLTLAMAANTLYKWPMAVPYLVPTTGYYYIAWGLVSGGQPTVKGQTAKTDGTLAGTTPPVFGVSSVAYVSGLLTGPYTPMAAGAQTVGGFWAAVS